MDWLRIAGQRYQRSSIGFGHRNQHRTAQLIRNGCEDWYTRSVDKCFSATYCRIHSRMEVRHQNNILHLRPIAIDEQITVENNQSAPIESEDDKNE